jgi:hypothetical protein
MLMIRGKGRTVEQCLPMNLMLRMSGARRQRPKRASGTRSHAAAILSIPDPTLFRGTLAVATTHHLIMKRSRVEEDDVEHPAKVRRVSNPDRLSKLSDELLVRILSFLPVSSLLISQR